MIDDVKQLTQLGNNTVYKYENPDKSILETFPNKNPDRDYIITLEFPEFTSLCPKTGQPDFANIVIEYIPDKECIESKSLKLYFFAFRNFGAFMETITNKILTDIVEACHPRWCKVTGDFNPRGALKIIVTADYKDVKWNPESQNI